MDCNFEKNTITIFGKSEKLEALITRISSLNGEQLYGFFINRGIALPRKMNCMALMSVINERLKNLHASEISKEYLQRLKYYKNFTELQLTHLFSSICNSKELFRQYRKNLIQLILFNHVGLNLMDGEIKYLKDLKKLPMESFEEYAHYISSMSQEQPNTFDGENLNVLKECLALSATNQEIMELAQKYGIELSSSLKKNELMDYMKYYLVKAGDMNYELIKAMSVATLAELNAMCKKHRIPMSSNMTKKEMVNYFFFILSDCDIVCTSMRRIKSMPLYEPLEFTIDVSAYRGFHRDDTKRIIHYSGEENDEYSNFVNDLERIKKLLSEQKALQNEAETKETSRPNKKNSNQKEKEELPLKDEIVMQQTPIIEEPKEVVEEIPEEKPEEIMEEETPQEIVEEIIETSEMEETEPEEVTEPETEETSDEVAEEVPAEEVEVVYVDEDGNPVDITEEDVLIVEEATDEEPEEVASETPEEKSEEIIEEPVEEAIDDIKESEEIIEEQPAETVVDQPEENLMNPEQQTPEEQEEHLPKEDEQPEVLSLNDVRENEAFGNKKLMKMAKNPAKKIMAIVGGCVAVGVVVFVIWALLR